MNHATPTRRHFLKLSAGAIAAPYVWTGLQARGESKNDRIGVGSIGVSTYKNIYGRSDEFDGQGSSIGRQAAARGNMVACADVNLHHAERFAKPYEGKCQMYQDYRKLLDRKDIDAVTIGTPDHWHTKIAIDAMRAGKDVYCEKPLTLTIDEGKLLTKVAKQTGAVFQVGTQQRSEHDLVFLKAAAMCRTGRLGKKLKAISSVGQPDFAVGKLAPGPFAVIAPPAELDWDFWLGQAPKVPYSKERCNFHFRWWYEYSGGQVTDWGVHHTDIAMWAMGLDHTGPTEIGGTSELPHVPGGFNVATKFDIDMRFDDGQEIKLVSGPNELILFGDKGRIRVNRGGLTGKPVEELTAKDNEELAVEMKKIYRGKQPGSHMTNFFECIKDRSLPISDVFSHHRTVTACHLANVAIRLGRAVKWDPAKEEFPGDAEANAMMSRPQRKPYAIEA
jgi:myo-inositol 2-dehydrogenase / D-chiro-inositol 1-dehydrogenase